MVCFSGILDNGKIERFMMIKVCKSKGKLDKMIKYAGSKYNYCSYSPKIRQALMYWSY